MSLLPCTFIEQLLGAKSYSRQCEPQVTVTPWGAPPWWTVAPLSLDAFSQTQRLLLFPGLKMQLHFLLHFPQLRFPFSFWCWFFPPSILGLICFFSFLPCAYPLGSSSSEHNGGSCLIIPSSHCAFGRKTLVIRHYKRYHIHRAF